MRHILFIFCILSGGILVSSLNVLAKSKENFQIISQGNKTGNKLPLWVSYSPKLKIFKLRNTGKCPIENLRFRISIRLPKGMMQIMASPPYQMVVGNLKENHMMNIPFGNLKTRKGRKLKRAEEIGTLSFNGVYCGKRLFLRKKIPNPVPLNGLFR